MATRVVTERVQPNDRGLYVCPKCTSEYASQFAAAECCDETYEPDDH